MELMCTTDLDVLEPSRPSSAELAQARAGPPRPSTPDRAQQLVSRFRTDSANGTGAIAALRSAGELMKPDFGRCMYKPWRLCACSTSLKHAYASVFEARR